MRHSLRVMGNGAFDVTDSRGILEAAGAIKVAFANYASPRREGAPYAVVGTVRIPSRGVVSGILAFAENEFYAHLLCRSLSPYAVHRYGAVCVRRTEWSPDGADFDVGNWRTLMRDVPSVARVRWDRIIVTPQTAPDLHEQLESLCGEALEG